jgi:hypothetical protein
MDNFTKLSITTITIAVLFILGWLADSKKPQVITYLPVEDLKIKENVVEISPKPQQEEPVPQESEINSTGLIIPGSVAYTLTSGKLVKVGKLVKKALSCVILKEINKDFYLVVVVEDGYKNDRWIVNKKNIKIIDKSW